MSADYGTLLQKLWDHLLFSGLSNFDWLPPRPYFGCSETAVQRDDHVVSGQICRDMVRIGNADVRRRPGGNIGDNVVVYLSVVGIQPQVYRNIRIQGLEIRDRLLVNVRLTLVRVIFGPKGQLVLLLSSSNVSGAERPRRLPRAVAAGQENGTKPAAQKTGKTPFPSGSSFDSSPRYARHDLFAEYKEQYDERHADHYHRRHHRRDIFAAETVLTDLLDSVGYKEKVSGLSVTSRGHT